MKNEYFAKFDEKGHRQTSIPRILVDDYGGEKKLITEGYIVISDDDYHYYVGNNGMGDHGTGYIRDSETWKPISAPAIIITTEDQANAIFSKYQTKVTVLKDDLATAMLLGDEELVAELKSEYAGLMSAYQKELEEVG